MEPLNIRFVVGNIAQTEADALINAANPYLAAGSGVCGALFEGAGEGLRGACDAVIAGIGRPLRTGEAAITPAFNLPARWIIHAVAPMCMGRWDESTAAQMTQTYRSIFETAQQNGLKTIAIPAMGLGVYRCDPLESTRCAREALDAYASLPERSLVSVTFVVRNESLAHLYRDVFAGVL